MPISHSKPRLVGRVTGLRDALRKRDQKRSRTRDKQRANRGKLVAVICRQYPGVVVLDGQAVFPFRYGKKIPWTCFRERLGCLYDDVEAQAVAHGTTEF